MGTNRQLVEPTPEESRQICLADAAESARVEAYWRDRLRHILSGDPNVAVVRRNIAAAVSNRQHWESVANYYLLAITRASCEGGDMAGPREAIPLAAGPGREVGGDDGDDDGRSA